MSKYQPLSRLFGGQSASKIRASFDEIERILGFKLPKSAHEYEAWWSNNEVGHSHARAWLGAGWRTEDLNLARREVTFARAVPASGQQGGEPKHDPWGCMADTITIDPAVDLTAPSGEQWNAERGLLLNE